MILGLCRSGTTALLSGVAQHPQTRCFYQPVKTGIRMNGRPDYAFYDHEPEVGDDAVLVAKETFGHNSNEECAFNPFPSPEAIIQTRPVFLFRDPVATYNSWSRLGWGSLEYFELAMSHCLELLNVARDVSDKVSLIFYEDLVGSPQVTIKKLCKKWEINFDSAMVNWRTPILQNAKIFRDFPVGSPRGFEAHHHETVRESRAFVGGGTEITLAPDIADEIRKKFHDRFNNLKLI